jgi:hypothetical protein
LPLAVAAAALLVCTFSRQLHASTTL